MSAPTGVLLQARPKATSAVFSGRYSDVLRGWEAQLARFRRYLASECAAGRLPSATGQALLELAGSEFWITLDQSAQTAIGEAVLTRTGALAAGAIKKGHRFARTASPDAKPSIAAAQFVASSPVYVRAGQTEVLVPLDASVAGVGPNTLQIVGQTSYPAVSVDTLFDPALAVTSVIAAGGSTGVDDPWGRVITAAAYVGQFGPNDSALLAGAFEAPRVRRVACALDSVAGVAKLFIADASWGSSGRLAQIVRQNLRNKWLGFGARADVLPVQNVRVNVDANVTLKGPQFLDDIADITDAVRAAIKGYFDARPDFYTFKLRTLRGLVARCDKRILTCSSAAVLDGAGAAMTEPPARLSGSATYATHYLLTDDAISTTFEIPS